DESRDDNLTFHRCPCGAPTFFISSICIHSPPQSIGIVLAEPLEYTKAHTEMTSDASNKIGHRPRSLHFLTSLNRIAVMKTHWSGVFPAVTTQLHKDESINFDATASHLEVLIESGVKG